MVDAATAGINPAEFYDLTIGEITVAIEGYHERERQSTIGRITAILRGLSKKGNPYQGLTKVREEANASTIGKAADAWLWRED